MQPIYPGDDYGTPLIIGVGQYGVNPLPACLAVDDENHVLAITRWEFTVDERAAIAAGEHVIITQIIGKDGNYAPIAAWVVGLEHLSKDD